MKRSNRFENARCDGIIFEAPTPIVSQPSDGLPILSIIPVQKRHGQDNHLLVRITVMGALKENQWEGWRGWAKFFKWEASSESPWWCIEWYIKLFRWKSASVAGRQPSDFCSFVARMGLFEITLLFALASCLTVGSDTEISKSCIVISVTTFEQ
jgi:hypothetical protein